MKATIRKDSNIARIKMEGVHPSQRKSMVFQSIVVSGIILGGKEEDKESPSSLSNPLNPFGKDPDGEEPHFEYTVPQKVHYQTYWKHHQDAENWINFSRAQDQGFRYWRTKSFAIITFATVLGDCIDCVISQNGDRVIFERLATPRPAPRVT